MKWGGVLLSTAASYIKCTDTNTLVQRHYTLCKQNIIQGINIFKNLPGICAIKVKSSGICFTDAMLPWHVLWLGVRAALACVMAGVGTSAGAIVVPGSADRKYQAGRILNSASQHMHHGGMSCRLKLLQYHAPWSK